MPILKLERVGDRDGQPFSPPKHVHLNTALIESWMGHDNRTAVKTASGERWWVAIAPDELATAMDPDACPDQPCGYDEYLGRGDGSGDLSHRGWHGAVKLANEHGRSCRVWERGNVCSTCVRHEERLRA